MYSEELFEKLCLLVDVMKLNKIKVDKKILKYIKDTVHPNPKSIKQYIEYIEQLHGILTIFFKNNVSE